jgi:hypothetical protein
MDAKSAFSEIHDLLGACREAEAIAEVSLAKLVLKEANIKAFQRSLNDVLAVVTRHFAAQITAASGDNRFEPYRCAWFDVARYQTDVMDAALTWDVDPETLQLIVECRPTPQTSDGRQALKVPQEVRKLRESAEGRDIPPEILLSARKLQKPRAIPSATTLILGSTGRPWNDVEFHKK